MEIEEEKFNKFLEYCVNCWDRGDGVNTAPSNDLKQLAKYLNNKHWNVLVSFVEELYNDKDRT